jgi:hypothetical protein
MKFLGVSVTTIVLILIVAVLVRKYGNSVPLLNRI